MRLRITEPQIQLYLIGSNFLSIVAPISTLFVPLLSHVACTRTRVSQPLYFFVFFTLYIYPAILDPSTPFK